MAITTLSMVLTVFVLNLHHITDRPVPPWARKIVFVYLARAMGMCALAGDTSGTTTVQISPKVERRRQPRSSNGGFFRRSYTGLDDEIDETAAIFELQNRTNQPPETKQSNVGPSDIVEMMESPWILRNSHNTPNHRIRGAPSHPTSPAHAQNNVRQEPAEPLADNNRNEQRHKDREKEKTDQYAKDWKRMAEIFDRLFFWLFLLAILVTTLILFHPLTKSYIAQQNMSS